MTNDVKIESNRKKEVPAQWMQLRVIKRDRDTRVGGRNDDSGGCSKVS